MTVFIVDDEPLSIRYLEMLLKGTSLDIEVVGMASNGVKAIPKIIQIQPDFVFVDISMPIMDGLQMAEEVLRKNPAQKIFVLTAYRDFEYAKKSVSIGVADYILKNEISEEKLEDLIRKSVMDLEVERRRRHTVMETNLRNFFLFDNFPGVGEEETYKSKPLQRYVLMYIAPRPEIVLKHEEQRQRAYIDCYEIENNIVEEGIACRAFVELFRNEYCGIFFTQPKCGDIEQKCMKIAKTIMEQFERKLPTHICLISSPSEHFSMLQGSYNLLRSKLEVLYAGTQRIYKEREITIHSGSRDMVKQDDWLAQWNQILEKGNKEEADILLITHLMKLKENLSVWEYTEKIQQICRNMESLLKEKKMSPEILRLEDCYTDIQKLEQDLIESQDQYLCEQQKRRTSCYSRHILLAMEYIQKHYDQDISVSDIAEAAGISEGHLRKCFKNEMNVNVINYLTEYRLKCAKLLMKRSNENLDEIWRKTGFASAQYFSYVFKKKENITPREYMRMINNDEINSQNE